MTRSVVSRSVCPNFKLACSLPLAVLVIAFAGGLPRVHAFTIDVPFGFEPLGTVSSDGGTVGVEFITNGFKAKKADYVLTDLIIFQPKTGAVAAGEWRSDAGTPASKFVTADLVEGSVPFEEGVVWAWYLAVHYDAKGKVVASESNLVPVMLYEMDG